MKPFWLIVAGLILQSTPGRAADDGAAPAATPPPGFALTPAGATNSATPDLAPPATAFDAIDVQRAVELVEQLQNQSGPSSPALIEPLTSLADHYYVEQDYDRAAELYARARQVMRENDGFDTVREIPLVMQLVRTEEARGRAEESWQLEQALLALAESNGGAIETLPVYQELARRRLDIWERYRTGEFPPQIVLGCYYSKRTYNQTMGGRLGIDDVPDTRENCTAGDRRVARLALLIEARSYEMRAVDVLLQNGRYASAEMWTQLTQMLRTSYAVMRRARSYGDPPLADMMVRLLSYEPRDAMERLRRAEILIQLADMNVTRSRELDRYVGYDAVSEQYAQAYAMLQQEGLTQAELETIFAPAFPITLPSFARNRLQTSADTAAAGYIDVSFEITRQGKSRRVKILETSANVERADRRQLERLIGQTTYRPQMLDGAIAASAPVSLRYYIGLDQGAAELECTGNEDDPEACDTLE